MVGMPSREEPAETGASCGDEELVTVSSPRRESDGAVVLRSDERAAAELLEHLLDRLCIDGRTWAS
jgi:hypothetical protein